MSTATPFPATTMTPGWMLDVLGAVASTNPLAGRLPPWHALRAETQTAGRGRTGRHWVSDEGGLWLSAVLPCPGPRSRWAILPLAAGYAVLTALTDFGVSDLRLRWPNDLMVGPRKLAGLLVERFTDTTAVVGLGLNIFNHPESADTSLTTPTARLADLVPGDYSIDDVAGHILHALARTHTQLVADGFGPIAAALNRTWSEPRLVAVTLNGDRAPFTGHFEGIDDEGRLRVATAHDGVRLYDATEVALLRELD
jgi:BirA family biotin operon repressor/biotin-[acetyl-CoA-carboxylase] ligase